MEQRRESNYAAARDAQIKFRKEEFASGTGRSRNDAAVKDAQILP